MTREEAKEFLTFISHTLGNMSIEYLTEKDGEKMREAIKKLEQEEPSVNLQPKTGHWRAVYQGDEIINYRCSECEFGDTFGKRPYGMYYCPNCGARMERSDKECR